MPDSTRGSHSTRPVWLLVALLLAVAIVVPLLVPLYDRATPTFLGFPFFYWFQFMLIPIASLLTYSAFKLSQAATRRDRAARGQKPPAGERGGVS
ncbi:MAG TPA: DUF3311 domain-containing protein [Nocardioidaceae bacterium]|nr:DUF3311 domain-containing protein [Nocardioidaceae bacterium]